MFEKVLIANRGEIAVRVIRACKDLGIATVAVYSDVDKDAMHVKFADEAVCVGPFNAGKSYLNQSAILAAAKQKGVSAIHPGYGFLAENAEFAANCENESICFIGPSASTIALMGNKIKARMAAIKAGVPLFPGCSTPLADINEAIKLAKEIGFPVMLKASMGGGGKGLKVVHSQRELESAYLLAQSESQFAFGSSEMFLEKYCETAKHVEIQILADKFGHVVHLGERDCSLQRKHQKVVEESPCGMLDQKLREDMGNAAILLAKEANYSTVGTVEFLVDRDRKFYFLEMNTRIQVEHPVTEMVTNIDIVKEQLLAAAGQPLRWTQKDIKISGHAIECRINAEDPFSFIPSPGKISTFKLPGGYGVRVDTFAHEGYTILPYYDSLVAKLITRGETRDEAIRKMRRALGEFDVSGIKTNIQFHKKIMGAPAFIDGTYTTTCLDIVGAKRF